MARRLGRLAQVFGLGALAGGQPECLFLGGRIRFGPALRFIAVERRCRQGEMRIGQMRARQRHQVGAPGRQDRVDLVPGRDVTDGDGRDSGLVAHLFGEPGLEHAAIDRIGLGRGLAGRDVDQVAAPFLEHGGDANRVAAGDPGGADPVGRRDPDRHRTTSGPNRAHGIEHREREPHAVVQAAAVIVVAPVAERRDEARQQIAVRHVELQHVGAGLLRHPRRGDELGGHARHVVRRHLARRLVERVERRRRGRDQRPVARGERLVHAVPGHARRALAPGMADLHGEPGIGFRVHHVDDAAPRGGVLGPVEPGAARRDAPVGRDARHFGEDQPGAAMRERAEMDEMEIADRAVRGRIHVHRRDHDAVRELHVAQAQRREHRRRRLAGAGVVAGLAGERAGEPAIDAIDEAGIAHPQVLVCHLLGA